MSGSNPGATSANPLSDTETAANAPAYASIIERLGGNAWRLFQQLAGWADDGPPSIEPNPQGRHGRDYSGPPYGPAKRHPIATFTGRRNSTYVEGTEHWNHLSVNASSALHLPMRIWVRPHHVHPGAPYSRGYWTLYGARALAGSHTLTMNQVNYSAGTGAVQANTMSVSGSTGALYDWNDDGAESDFYTPLVPGWNHVELWISSNSATKFYIDSLVLSQWVKLGH